MARKRSLPREKPEVQWLPGVSADSDSKEFRLNNSGRTPHPTGEKKKTPVAEKGGVKHSKHVNGKARGQILARRGGMAVSSARASTSAMCQSAMASRIRERAGEGAMVPRNASADGAAASHRTEENQQNHRRAS